MDFLGPWVDQCHIEGTSPGRRGAKVGSVALSAYSVVSLCMAWLNANCGDSLIFAFVFEAFFRVWYTPWSVLEAESTFVRRKIFEAFLEGFQIGAVHDGVSSLAIVTLDPC